MGILLSISLLDSVELVQWGSHVFHTNEQEGEDLQRHAEVNRSNATSTWYGAVQFKERGKPDGA